MPTPLQRRIIKPTGWFDTAWQFRRRITFDNSAQAAALTDFPAMVKLDSTRINYANTKAGGADLRFTDAAGNVLAHEIDVWNAAGTSIVWVKVPSIGASSTGDYINMYYGCNTAIDGQQATSTWRTEYKSVWHLKETGAGTAGEYKDSTSTANHGQGGGGVAGSTPTASTSNSPPTGTSQVFNGTGSWIKMGAASVTYTSGSVSVGGWVRRTATPADDYGAYILTDYQAGSPSWISSFGLNIAKGGVGLGSANDLVFFWENPEGTTPFAETAATLALNTWVHVVGVWNGTNRQIYVNGATSGSAVSTAQSRTSPTNGVLALGRAGNGAGQYLPGELDEIFVYHGAMSAAWIAATYKSQSDTFASYGPEQSVMWG